MKKILLYLSLLFILNSCAVSSKKISEVSIKTEKVAANNFRSDYKILYNKNYKLAAIYKEIKTKTVGKDIHMVKIMVYDIENNKVLWGRKAINAKLEWISKYKLQVKYMDKDKKHKTLIYDTKTKQVSFI